jgi:CBS domain-containing protein
MANKARDIMSGQPEYIGENETVYEAAQRMAKLQIGFIPVCGENGRLRGVVTDRDIVTEVIAQGKDPQSTSIGELANGKPVTIGADDSIDLAIQTMIDHRVLRLPVIDGHDLIGIVSKADIANVGDENLTGKLIESIAATGPNN